ncbi:hypothetical protein PHJA_001062000 [Phtheirospermum japonicum]|uniref:Uncharacterized protein n=1 Tax=Phtheirospermum japonicum TaxID=374723 RepID=A0A830BZD0_9LAMI|nr:hypothetical protein PHJA_001062000 [Phtheirospermum japonicum]
MRPLISRSAASFHPPFEVMPSACRFPSAGPTPWDFRRRRRGFASPSFRNWGRGFRRASRRQELARPMPPVFSRRFLKFGKEQG